MQFNPFTKSFSDISVEDLAGLRTVSEGWYVEYKRDVPNASSIAKSIASFANQYGGWLFYGIDENRDEGTAGKFPGINATLANDVKMKIASAAAQAMQPTPYFETRFVHGPCEALNLGPDRGIVVVRVPRGAVPPYVHASGRIYRRVAHQSEPTAEIDRKTLDLLWARSNERGKQLRQFFRRERMISSKAESDIGRLHLYLFTDPLGDRGHRSNCSFKEFVGVAGSAPATHEGPFFDNFFPMAGGNVARHVGDNDARLGLVTLKHFGDNSAVISIPLNCVPLAQFLKYADERYEHVEAFIEMASEHSEAEHLLVLDLNYTLVLLATTLDIYRQLCEHAGIESSVSYKLHLAGIWRRAPFLDLAAYLDHLESHGLPIVQHSSSYAPGGAARGPLGTLKLQAGVPRAELEPYRAAIGPFLDVAWTVGVPAQVLTKDGLELLEIGTRATRGRPAV